MVGVFYLFVIELRGGGECEWVLRLRVILFTEILVFKEGLSLLW